MSATAELPSVFAALGDDTRWAILQRLGRAPASASELAREFPITRQGLANHVRVLREAGLVEAERVGREVRFRALGPRLRDVGRELDAVTRGWDRRLSAIKRAAEAPEDDA